MKIRDVAQLTKKRESKSFERRREIAKAELVDIEGDVRVTGRPGFVWASENSQPGSVFQIFNPNVQARAGLPVLLGYEPNQPHRRVVLSWDWETIIFSPDYEEADPFLPNHARSHEWPDYNPGGDAVTVYPRSLSMLRTYPGTSPGGNPSVSISPVRYEVNDSIAVFTGHEDYDISGSVPAAGQARYVLIYLDIVTNTISHTDGAVTVDADGIIPDVPDAAVRTMPSALVRLAGGQTSVAEADIVDVRIILGGVTGRRADILDGLAALAAEFDVTLSRTVMQLNQRITDRIAALEAEIDVTLSRHIVP